MFGYYTAQCRDWSSLAGTPKMKTDGDSAVASDSLKMKALHWIDRCKRRLKHHHIPPLRLLVRNEQCPLFEAKASAGKSHCFLLDATGVPGRFQVSRIQSAERRLMTSRGRKTKTRSHPFTLRISRRFDMVWFSDFRGSPTSVTQVFVGSHRASCASFVMLIAAEEALSIFKLSISFEFR